MEAFPKGERWEDVATTFYLVSKAKKITALGKPLYHYRQREGAITKEAVKDGVDLRGYYPWGPIDIISCSSRICF